MVASQLGTKPSLLIFKWPKHSIHLILVFRPKRKNAAAAKTSFYFLKCACQAAACFCLSSERAAKKEIPREFFSCKLIRTKKQQRLQIDLSKEIIAFVLQQLEDAPTITTTTTPSSSANAMHFSGVSESGSPSFNYTFSWANLRDKENRKEAFVALRRSSLRYINELISSTWFTVNRRVSLLIFNETKWQQVSKNKCEIEYLSNAP